jgi:Na+/melibiose symporter-like transporter
MGTRVSKTILNHQELEPLGNKIVIIKDKYEYSVFHMIVYGCTAMAYWMLMNSLMMFSTKFLFDVAKLPASLASIVALSSRIVDVFSDPICAFFLNRSKITKYGQMKPW